ncbi:helix-turn-helix transcriptional regulator [Bradyrhizobium sp. SSUT112]|uniref:helix-turn-helix domain-containing protein n=1 Tax=unclassified Bradyrhizobium TaxID=2631580 RepID=UPI0024499167|nr:helix-turn-helix transcriptional regulator [Bradyrhizobium sp. SSUT112]MDH2356541.1 helix-turn-helix transcriptional regulator [Bradyrhizobium sp. SSUT112]
MRLWPGSRLRVQRGIPQEQLAYDARIDRSYMGRIEQKKENPTIDLLDRIAATLGVHLSELFAEPAKCAMPPKPMSRGRKPARQCRNMK